MTGYRGVDRRRSLETRPSVLGTRVVLVLLAVGTLVSATTPLAAARDHLVARLVLDGFAIAAVAAVAVVAGLRWRWFGDARALFVSVGAVAFAVTLGHQFDLLAMTSAAVEAGAASVAIIAIIASTVTSPVDDRLRPGVVATLALVGGLAATAGWAALPSAVDVAGVVGASTIVVGVVAVVVGLRAGTGVVSWAGVAATAVGAGPVAHLLGAPEPSTAATAVQVAALISAAIGSLLALRDAVATAHRRLAEERRLRHDLMRGAARDAGERAARDHATKNSLAAIDAATTALVRRLDVAVDDPLHEVGAAVRDELGRLRRMLGARDDHGRPGDDVDLAPLVRRLTLVGRLDGHIVVDLPPDPVVVTGHEDEIAEALRNLLHNALSHGAAPTPVEVVVVRGARDVRVSVRDRGPGVDPGLLEHLGRRQVASDRGEGIGLFVSRRQLREQGGDLSVHARSGGGLEVTMVLPAAVGAGSPVVRRTPSGSAEPVGAFATSRAVEA